LIPHGHLDGVVFGLSDIHLAELAGDDLFLSSPEPTRNRVASDHGRGERQRGLSHRPFGYPDDGKFPNSVKM
jgi:hypothetical protein